MANELGDDYDTFMARLCARAGERLGVRVTWSALPGWAAEVACEGATARYEPPSWRYFEEVGTTPSAKHVDDVVEALRRAGVRTRDR